MQHNEHLRGSMQRVACIQAGEWTKNDSGFGAANLHFVHLCGADAILLAAPLPVLNAHHPRLGREEQIILAHQSHPEQALPPKCFHMESVKFQKQPCDKSSVPLCLNGFWTAAESPARP